MITSLDRQEENAATPTEDRCSCIFAMSMTTPSRRAPAFVGTSGFSYSDWKGLFYPEKLPSREWLHYYSTRFNTVEINLTFYRSPAATTLTKWRESVPAQFVFVLKASRMITHMKRLGDCDQQLRRMASEFSPLAAQLACILFQLPPSFAVDRERLASFVDLAQSSLEKAPIRPFLAFEFRHSSWFDESILALLAKSGCPVVIHDMERAGGWLLKARRLTAGGLALSTDRFLAREQPLLYLRFHGPSGRYAGSYGAAKLRPWATFARSALERGLPVHAYFNNDVAGAALHDAACLDEMLRK
jgi:uncharacterized protein YecE (DUF72 family)